MSGCSRVIREMHQANYEAYGYRRTWKALRRAGETAPRCRVQRLMRAHGIQGAKRRGKPWRTTIPDPERAAAARIWSSATSPPREPESAVGRGSVAICAAGRAWSTSRSCIDVFSRRVVGWQLAGHMRTDLVLDALRMALGTREHGADFRLVAHTDRGSQYTSADYTQVLDDHHVLASVGIGRRRLRQRDGRDLRRHRSRPS